MHLITNINFVMKIEKINKSSKINFTSFIECL